VPGTWFATSPADGDAVHKERFMGKYFLGWLLGVPVVVLVLIWLFFG
jgi:hypothetical protein